MQEEAFFVLINGKQVIREMYRLSIELAQNNVPLQHVCVALVETKKGFSNWEHRKGEAFRKKEALYP